MQSKFALLLCLGCAAGAEAPQGPEWKYAVAYADCAPWDGAATTILLSNTGSDTTQEPPYLRLSLYLPLPTGRVRAEVGSMQSGGMAASLCEASDNCQAAQSGWVSVAPEGSRLTGRYDLRLADGRVLRGGVDARVIALRRVLCG